MSPPRGPMDGLSKEERRRRALELLKARPQSKAPPPADPRGDPRDAALRERERELEERALRLEERTRELEEQVRRLEHAREQAVPPVSTPPARTETEPSADVATPTKPKDPRRRRSLAGRGRKPASHDSDVTDQVGATTSTTPAPARARRAATDGAVLEVRAMDVHYGKIQALRGIDLAIRPGEVVALLGANGAGKSSTLRAISGMVTPSAGEILFEGQPIGGLSSHEVVKHGIAHVPEGRQLFPNLSVEENLRFGFWPLRGTGARLGDNLDHVYSMFPRLKERRSQAAGTMSGGEQQMLVFGRALMSSPRLLLVDEMSLGLAPMIVKTLFDAVEQIHEEGSSVILVEQFVHQALRHSQRAYVLGKGEMVLEAPSSKLANDPNLLAAYLGGAEGHIEEDLEPTPARKTPGSTSTGRRSAKPRK